MAEVNPEESEIGFEGKGVYKSPEMYGNPNVSTYYNDNFLQSSFSRQAGGCSRSE